MRILLACCAGMSTSLIVERMIQECEKQGKAYQIWTVDQSLIEQEIGKFDVLLLGPQVRHALKRVQRLVKGSAPVAVIRNQDYGGFDGKAVLAYAEELVEQFSKHPQI